MPRIDFKLASQRMASGGSNRRLNPVFMNSGAIGGLRSAYIAPKSANVQYTPAPIPRPVIDTTLEAASDFAQVWSDAAFRFQKRETKAQADQAALKYREEASKLFYGYQDESGEYVPGYGSTEKNVATEGFTSFQDRLGQKMKDYLGLLSPAAKQEALLDMSAVRNTYLNKAAIHKSKELKKLEESIQYQKQQDLMRDITADPSSIYKKDPTTGLNNKEKFYRAFPDVKSANQEWFNLIQESTEKIYLEQGLKKAQDFYNKVAKVELAQSPKHITSVLSNINRWEHEATRAYNSSIDIQIKREKQAKQKLWDESKAKLESDRLQGRLYSEHDLGVMVKAGFLDPSYARAYANDEYGEMHNVTKPERMRFWVDKLTETAKNGFIDKSGKRTDWAFLDDVDGLDGSGRQQLTKLQQDLTNPKFQNNFQRGRDKIKTWFKGEFWERGIYARENDSLINDATEELWNRLKSGESYDEVIGDMQSRMDPVVVDIARLPALKTGSKPNTINDLKVQRALIATNLASGKYTSEIARAERQKLYRYYKWLIHKKTAEKGTVK